MQETVVQPQQRRGIHRGPAFVFEAEHGILSGRPKGAELLEALMAHLRDSPEYSAAPLDFSGVSFVDVSCADEMLNKLLLRLRSGELHYFDHPRLGMLALVTPFTYPVVEEASEAVDEGRQ